MDRRTFLKSSAVATVSGLTATASLAGTALSDNAHILTLSMEPSTPAMDTELIARRISEVVEAATAKQLQIVAAEDNEASHCDLVLAPASKREVTHTAWSSLQPEIHAMDASTFDGWMATGGGTPLIEQLEAETGEKIFLTGQGHRATGLFASPDLETLAYVPDGSIRPQRHLFQLAVSGERPANAETAYFALPQPIAGEPIALSMSRQTWDSLAPTEQAIMTSIAAAEHARVVAETTAAVAMTTTLASMPPQRSLPHKMTQRYLDNTALERDRIIDRDRLAGEILASQHAYRKITGSEPDGFIQDIATRAFLT